MELTFSEAMRNLLHLVSQGLLIPTMVILAFCVAVSIFTIGSVIVEYFCEHRHYRVNMPDLLAKVERAETDDLDQVIENSGMLYSQRYWLQVLVRYMGLPEESLTNLAKRILATTEQHYNRKVSRTDTLSKISPMLGLMGTLIPLGPGIVALGQGQTEVLASSLMIAFDTTVIGLVTSVVCFVVSRIRRGWYEDYVVSMESALVSILEKARDYTGESIDELTDDELAALVPARMKGWLGRIIEDGKKAKAERLERKAAQAEDALTEAMEDSDRKATFRRWRKALGDRAKGVARKVRSRRVKEEVIIPDLGNVDPISDVEDEV